MYEQTKSKRLGTTLSECVSVCTTMCNNVQHKHVANTEDTKQMLLWICCIDCISELYTLGSVLISQSRVFFCVCSQCGE